MKLFTYMRQILKVVNGETISACDSWNLEKFSQMLNEVHLLLQGEDLVGKPKEIKWFIIAKKVMAHKYHVCLQLYWQKN